MTEIEKKILWEKDEVAVGELIYRKENQAKTRKYIELKKKVILIVPVENNYVYLLKEYRPLIGKVVWRVPAGHLEKDENAVEGAARELLEETGFKAEKLTKMGQYNHMGWVIFPMTLVKAEGLKKSKQHLEFYENIDLIKVTKEEARKIALNEMVEPHHSFAVLKALEK